MLSTTLLRRAHRLLSGLPPRARRSTLHFIRCESTTAVKTVLRPTLSSSREFCQPKLTEEISQDLPRLKPASQHKIPTIEHTVLSNQLRVVSTDTYGQAAIVGLYIDVGSRFEDDSNQGVSHLLEHLTFKSTTSRSHADFIRTIEEVGGLSSSIGSRDQLSLSIDLMRNHVATAVELLADTVQNPLYQDDEVDACRAICAIDIEAAEENPAGLLSEMIHEAAYGRDSNLGRRTATTVDKLPSLTKEVITSFSDRYLIPSRMVLAASGVSHAEIVALTARFFKTTVPSKDVVSKDIEASKDYEMPSASPYVGGHVMMDVPDAECSHVSLAFNASHWHSDDLFAVCVLQILLGGGSSFSAGGPGKGMYSRLYTDVLNEFNFMEEATCFTSLHNDQGLLGIYAASSPAYTMNMVAILVNQMVRLAVTPVESQELRRAKNQLKSSLLMNLESRAVVNEDMGRQFMFYGKYVEASTLCAKIEAVTAEMLQEVVQKAVSRPPSVVFYGAPKNFPSYDQLTTALAAGLTAAAPTGASSS